ncbi:MAG TPA: ankyrin repeat domain-containing protein [Gemmatimonadaceae bacterium]|nr:ankyrin repeat domain-containing protein [Gemmatimonadaceae bacterium]
MGVTHQLPWTATRDDYEREADALLAALKAREDAALWNFKWMHPFYRGKAVRDVEPDKLDLDDARLVVAHEYFLQTWHNLMKFADEVSHDEPAAKFERAVEAVISGDIETLKVMIRDDPQLVHARSLRSHRATLLHYTAANGVEGVRQKTPPNAVDVARLLLDAGADPNALAIMYDHLCTTMSMLVSSAHPANAGVQADLAELLLDYGAKRQGDGSEWQSDIMTALAFGYTKTAQRLAKRGVPPDSLPAAAGLGRVEEVVRLLPTADERRRQVALALAAQHGHAEVVKILLDAGEDPNRLNPEGFHAHSTPLHQAIAAGRENVVRLLLDRGARTDIKDTVYGGTALGWAVYCEQPAIADELRNRGAPRSN